MPDTNNENQIRTLVENWAAAVRARDIEGAVAHHTDDIVMFDVPLPLQSRGLADYGRRGNCSSPITAEVRDHSMWQTCTSQRVTRLRIATRC
jgi:ketosteroid isomerase-like protein